MTTVTRNDEENEAPGVVPAGTAGTGRTPRSVTKERRQTVKAKKSRAGARKTRKRTARKPPGRHVPGGVAEAARILKEQGYIVGRVIDPACPISLIAHKGREMLSVAVVRPREPVMNASDVRYWYSREVLELQPYWNSDADNIQFWLFSRVAGLLRYRVFRGGIWNVETMQNGWQEKRVATADQETENEEVAVQRSRTAPSPVRATGHG